jgi:membrane carboxypeptidase/penicillin-binding protein
MVLQSIGLTLNIVMNQSLDQKKVKKYPSEEQMKDSAKSPNYINEFSQIENMMKKVLLTLGLLLATTVMAEEQPIADKELITELKQYCTELAQEDGTNGKELKVFMLECVNEELDSEGYQPLTTLV